MTLISRRHAVAVAVLLPFVGLGLSGCATDGSRGAPSVAPGTCPASSPAARVNLSETDNGALVCLARTGMVELYLHATAANRWSPIAVTGAALHSVPSGKSSLPIGVTAGFFAATGAGRAVLSSYRAPCAAADPQAPGCDGGHLLRIVVVVVG